jgi:L-ectoine synthase
MIVRRLDELPPDATVSNETWISRRLLLAGDRMGFSLHDTVLRAGTETPMWYRNHLEAVYCIGGEGEIRDLATGEVHAIRTGTVYALDQHDKHVLVAKTELRMVCVFSPPLVGPENHDADGSYPLMTLGDEG